MAPLTQDEVIFVVGYKGEQIESWIRENYGHLNTHFIVQAEALGQAHAVWLCREFLQDDEEVVVAFGDGIVSADYAAFTAAEPQVDGVFLVREVEDPRRFGVVVSDENGFIRQFVEKPEGLDHRDAIVGINWFRDGRQLCRALDKVMAENRQTLGEYFMVDAYEVMLEQGARFTTQPVAEWEDAGKPEATLQTNRRLLALGYGSADALERSYAEGYTVIPPVYIHPTANIDAAVIGPYTTVEANVTIRNAIVRNSIIDPDATVENCILDNALVGERATVTGKGRELFVGDDSVVEL
jgi:glucose-1-phosphate thymidylyltransferase